MTTRYAKAAATLVFTSGVEGFEQAVQVYDALANSSETVADTLDEFPGVCRWSEVDHMTDDSWWEEVEMLARNIDKAHKLFGGT